MSVPVTRAVAAGPRPPKVNAARVVPTTELKTTPLKPPAAPPPARSAATAWPAAAEAVVVPSDPRSRVAARADRTPVTITTAGSAKSLSTKGSVRVKVADRASTERAGVVGVLLSVSPASAADPGPVSVGLDYSGFRDAIGGDFAGRLRMVQLPACALTTPEAPACRTHSPIPSRNDSNAKTLSADVALPTAGAAAKAPEPVVLAAVAGAEGPSGSFAATPLSPAGSWSVDGNSGAFTWSYPVPVQTPAAGGAPAVALSYNSSSVDGRTSTTNGQSSWVGQGWDYDPGFVERTYRTCADDKTLPAAQQTGDLCWSGHLMTMSLNGRTVSLVRDDTTGAWHPQSDDGSRVELVEDTAPGNNGTYRGQFWKITTTDGTQYFFGRTRGPGHTNQERTNSAYPVRVYSPRNGDPCYNSAGFAQSWCDMGWRWNLDYVVDPRGNAMAYYYDPETNYYGANNQNTGVVYTRGGTLKRIDYGLRLIGGSIYTQTTPNQVVFTTAERCVPAGGFTCDPAQFTVANALKWPDTPVDQNCGASGSCANHAPTFWSRKRLTTITTYYNTGQGPVPVDSVQLGQDLPAVADSELRLDSLTHTGHVGGTITQPAVRFTSQVYDNRVQGYGNMSGLAHWRLTNIQGDTGLIITVKYSDKDCTATTVPTNLSANTSRCFPVYRTLPGNQNPTLDFFHKYVVTQVLAQDRNQYSPDQQTDYTYLGGAAWHYDDNELVKPEYRTYGQFRGYRTVEVRSGDNTHVVEANAPPDKRTLTRTTYYTGMDQDILPNNARRSTSFTNSLNESVVDTDQLAGSAHEIQTFDGDGGSRVSTALSNGVVIGTTATRGRAGLDPAKATLVGTQRSRSITDLAAGGTRSSGTLNRYDTLGRVVSTTETADGLPSMCTTNTYADNTTSWIRSLVSEVLVSQQECPTNGAAPAPVVSGARTLFDGSAALGQVPGAGNPTTTITATANNSGTLTWTSTGSATFDGSGRTLTKTDQRGKVTSIAYTPAEGGVLSKTVTTNPKSQTSTIEVEPARGKAVLTTDVGGRRTEMAYDALGRLVSGWLPGRPRSGLPSMEYTYLQRTDGPSAITSRKLVDSGAALNQIVAVELYDAFGKVRQTQTETASNKRQVIDAFYDSHGWEVRANKRYLTAGAPSTTFVAVDASTVDDRTATAYDGFGRETLKTSYQGTTKVAETRTVYGGDRTTVVPPPGGTTETAVTDTRGRKVQQLRYSAPPTINGNVVSGGTAQSTTYRYTATGLMDRITDNAGNTWSYDFDFLGRKTSQTDPDSGTSTVAYDLAGLVTTTTDARGRSLAHEYDDLGRKTATYSGTVPNPNNKLATFTYDGATNGAGKPYTATRYTADGTFITAVTMYDTAGNPNRQVTQVPAAVTGLNGTYTTNYAYTTTGQVSSITPANGGGLPGETISIGYDRFGKPTSAAGYNTYVLDSTYTDYGEALQYTLGPSNNKAWLSYDYDAHTRRPIGINLSVQAAAAQSVDDTRYTYDAVGNITKSINTRGDGVGATTRTQCYGYDALNRLEKAWTATDACAAAPSSSTVGGPDAYWLSWSFDSIGLRAQQVKHGVGGNGDTTTNYAYQAGKVHALSGTTTTGPSGTTTQSFGYDTAGNTTTRGDQTLTWDDEARLSKVTTPTGSTSYTYDADGSQLLRRTATETTLFLPGQELARDNTTGVVTGTRYYTHNGTRVAQRVGGGNPVYLVGDLQGTSSVAVNSVGFAVTRRTMDPYGNPIGGVTNGPWPNQRGFLDQPVDQTTGLTDMGARKYDPVTGRFLSVDPVLDENDPDQLCGYSYASNNPVSKSDATGLMAIVIGIGAKGVDEAQRIVGDLQAHGFQNYRTAQISKLSGVFLNRWSAQGPYNASSLVPFVIYFVTFVRWADCSPAKPASKPAFRPNPLDRKQQAAWNAKHPEPPPTPADRSVREQLRDMLVAFTGVDDLVSCFKDGDWASCAGFFGPMAVGGAAGWAGKKIMQGASKGVRGVRSSAGHSQADNVIPGGRSDGETVFSGHGYFDEENGEAVVPEGTTLHMYTKHGGFVDDDDIIPVEMGARVKPTETFRPGDRLPNYTLDSPDELWVVSGSYTVDGPTLLSELLRPNMGICHWAACREI
ncbi:RHS repeat-associated core domain-containing protein [Actinokineospora auranticolor]|nr:RHS repeat-associated core domain-containing protein [Actinokineospora auranticolor]